MQPFFRALREKNAEIFRASREKLLESESFTYSHISNIFDEILQFHIFLSFLSVRENFTVS